MDMRRLLSGSANHTFVRTALILASLLVVGCGAGASDAPGRRSSASGAGDTLEYSCGRGDTFTAADVAAEREPAEEVLAALHELRQTMDGAVLPEQGWLEVGSSNETVTLIAPLNDAYASAAFERTDGEWQPSGWGECVPRLQLPDRSVLRWAFSDASYPPDPDATQLELLVSEVECSSGRDIDGLIEPTVTYDREQISVLLTAPGLSGKDQTCQGMPPTSYALTLDEAPGERKVVDPSVFPAVEPTPGTRLP